MPLNNLQEQALTDNGYIYLVGNSPSSIASRDVWYTRPNADGSISSFSTQTNALPSANKVQAAAVAANGYLYTYGGYSTSPSNNTTSLYYSKLGNNGTPGTWATSANTLPASRSFLGQESVTLNGYIYAIGGEDTSSNATTTVYRASLSRIQVAGSLDLVGTNAQNLADGNSGGELTAGNTNIVGTIQATGNASFLQNVSVNANLTVQGDAYIGATLTVGGNVTLTTGVVTSGVADGATAIAHTLNTSVSYATSGDLLLAVENNGVKEFSIDRGGHIITGGSTPTATVNTTDAGTGATCTISGDDTAGQVTIATGTGTLLSGTECAITYATSFANTPVVILSSANGNASGRNIYSATSGDTTTGFDISFGQAPFSGTYIINYIVIK